MSDKEDPTAPVVQYTLKQVQGSCRNIVSQFRDEQCQIKTALEWYKIILQNYVSNLVYDEEQRTFIFEHFLEESCTALMKREHQHYQRDYNNADLIASCCKLLVTISVPLIKDDHPLAMHIIYYCLNAGNAFFRTFGNDWVCTLCPLCHDQLSLRDSF